jgi:hypothetical protein
MGDCQVTRVVNLRQEPYDVYIGRPGNGESGYFGNPYSSGTRSQNIEAFRRYFLDRVEKDPSFRQRVLELKGKRLGCFCHPAPCHGDVIAGWLEELWPYT